MLSYTPGPYGPSTSVVTLNNTQIAAQNALNIAQAAQTATEQETLRAESVEATIQQSIPAALPYDFTFSALDPITASEIIGGSTITHVVTIPQNATGSIAKCTTAPTTSASQFDLLQNGNVIGTVSFAQGSVTGSFTFAAAVQLAIGDVVEARANATTFDTSISVVFITLVASYVL